MESKKRYEAIIFDLDGTLLDTWPGLASALRAQLPSASLNFPNLLQALSTGISPMFELALTQANVSHSEHGPLLARLWKTYLQDFVLQAQMYPGVEELLEHLQQKHIRLGICTNRDRVSSLQLVSRYQLAPEVLVCLDDTPNPKPHPLPLQTCMEQLGSNAESTLFVGDSHIDAQCAHAAGVAFAAHMHGYHRHIDELFPSVLRFDSYAQLLQHIQQ